MFRSVLLPGLALLASLAAGCNSSSSNTPNSGQTPDEPTMTPEAGTPMTGVFLDSPVSGLAYSAGPASGITDVAGKFDYQAGNTVQFSLGDIELPSIPAAGFITPFEVFETRNSASARVQNLARLLQSLDLDGNPDNGIEIGPEAALAATGLQVDFAAPDFDRQVMNLVANSGSVTTSLIPADQAMAHLLGTLAANGLEAAGCSLDHPAVGRTAEFVGEFHEVGGTLEVIDNCTLEVREFTYDGGGPDVAFYGGQNRDYLGAAGVRLGPRLNGRVYAGETIRLNLPDGVTLDDIDSLSVWCFDFAVSFGDVYFGT